MFAIVATEEVLTISNVGGGSAINLITYGLDSDKRLNALKVTHKQHHISLLLTLFSTGFVQVYTLFVVFQMLGLWLSHHIVIYKNDIREKALQMQFKAKIKLRRGMKYAFFISHHQGSGGDQCNTLALEFERLVSSGVSKRRSVHFSFLTLTRFAFCLKGFPVWYDQVRVFAIKIT